MIKRFFSLLLSVLMITSYTAPYAFAQNQTQQKTQTANYENLVPKKLELSMKDSIAHIYGKENVDAIYSNIELMIKQAKFERRPDLYEDDLKRDSDWYKDEVVYMFYREQFGVYE